MIRFFTFLFLVTSFNLSAQLADGTLAPNFDLTDIDGNDHNLYDDVLDNDKHALLDFSATWCGPCWTFHNSGTLETLYDDYGPSGSDELQIFMLEASASTNTACLYGSAGCNNSTYGDWTQVDYPIFSLEGADLNVSSDYEISYFPTIYLLNKHDNRVWETAQASVQFFENLMLESFELEVEDQVIQDVDCQNLGSIDIDVVGGYNSLDYEWSNGETTQDLEDLEEGDYYLTITDFYGYFIERGPFTIDFSGGGLGDFDIEEEVSNDVTCNGNSDGYLEVSVSGGVGNYAYQWSNGGTQEYIQNLSPGTYSVIVTDDVGCTDSEIFEIEEPEALVETIIAQDPDCSDTNGVVEITIEGGTGPFEYFLNDTYSDNGLFENVPAGTYDIFVEDINDCFISGSVTLTSEVAPTAMGAVSNELSCEVLEAELSGSGSSTGSNFSYAWKDEAGVTIATTLTTTVDQQGTYTLEVTDMDVDCISSAAVMVMGDYTPPVVTAENGTLTCSQNDVTICATQAGAESYFWMVDGEEVSDLCITVSSPGDYSFTGVGANGCSATEMATVDVDTDIPDAAIGAPNMLTCTNTNQIITATLNGNTSDYTFDWTTVDGNIVSVLSDLEIEVDQPGVYTLTVIDLNSNCQLISTTLVEQFINTPVAKIIADNDDDFLYLTDNSEGNPSAWSWSVDGVVVSAQEDFQYPLTGADSHEVCLEITNECETTQTCRSVSIVDPLTVDLSSVNIDCNGQSTGSITLTPTGGVAPYSSDVVGPNGFSSDQFSLSGLAAGLYVIEINDSETRSTQVTIELSENPAISIASDTKDPLCNAEASGEIALDLSGGVGSFDVAWSDGSQGMTNSNLGAGTFTATITDGAGCQTMESFTLSEPDAIVQQGNVNDVRCNGEANGSINLSIGGGTGALTYEWSNGETTLINANLPADTYTFTVNDENQCESLESYTVSEPDVIDYVIEELVNDIDGAGGSIDITPTGGISPYNFSWSNGADTEDVSNLLPGFYSVEIRDANDCLLNSEEFEIKMTSDTDEIQSIESLSIYPNPTSANLSIDVQFTQEENINISLLDASGRVIISAVDFRTRDLSYVMDVSQCSSGIYILNIATPQGTLFKRVSIIK